MLTFPRPRRRPFCEKQNQKNNTKSSYIMQSIFFRGGERGVGSYSFPFGLGIFYMHYIEQLQYNNKIINLYQTERGNYHFKPGTDQLLTITEKVCTKESVHIY